MFNSKKDVKTLDLLQKDLMGDSIDPVEISEEMLGFVAGGNVAPGKGPTIAVSICNPDTGRPLK